MGNLASGSRIARSFRIGEPPALCSRGSWSLHWRPGRAAGWAEAVLQAQGPGSRQRPGGIAQRAVSSYGLAYSGNIIVKHRGVDVLHQPAPRGASPGSNRIGPEESVDSAYRLDQRQSSARSTRPARNGLRSTYRSTTRR